MQAILANWRTSAGGMILIAIGVAELVAGVRVPGFTMEPGAALAAGISLLCAKDGGVK